MKSKLIALIQFSNKALFILGGIVGDLLLLLFRLNWGWQFFQTGQGKLLNHQRTVDFFTTLNIPAPELNAWFVAGVECVGGLALLAGVFSRPVGLVLSVNMLVAYLSVEDDRNALFMIFSDPTKFLAADPFYFLLVSLLVLAFGSGRISLDFIISKLLRRS